MKALIENNIINESNKRAFLNILESSSFLTAPASRGHHHNWPGGLNDHCREMWHLHLALKNFTHGGMFHDSSILTCIFLHDIYKAFNWYGKISDSGSEKLFYFHAKQFQHQIISTAKILLDFKIHLSEKELEAILAAEGGYSEIKLIGKAPLAKYIYCLDELSANVYNGAI